MAAILTQIFTFKRNFHVEILTIFDKKIKTVPGEMHEDAGVFFRIAIMLKNCK